MEWFDIMKIMISVLFTGFVVLIGKIVYDWLQPKEKKYLENEACIKKFETIDSRLDEGGKKIVKMSENIEEISRRVDEHEIIKTAVIKTEIILSELSKTVDKMEKTLEKNLDEAFNRIRDLEKN